MIARNKIPILLLFMVMATVAIAAGPNRISYQGSLTASGGAAIPDASYKMRFTMFDDPTVGTQLWQETQPGVQVIGGLFSTQLGAFTALPDDLFLNPGLYLEIEVDLSGNAAFETNEKYAPRQHILSPFLRLYSDNVCTGTLTLTANVKGGIGADRGVVYINPSGVTPGSKDTMFGMYNTNTSNPDGYDVLAFGEGGAFTVNGPLQGGCKYVPAGYSRIGNSTATEADIDAAEDLLISGSLEVQGNVHWSALTRNCAIHCKAFTPRDEGYAFFSGAFLQNDDGVTQYWGASVQLPDGAVVTKLTLYVDDSAVGNLNLALKRTNQASGSNTDMANVVSSGTPGYTSFADTTINDATIDNGNYCYFLWLQFPGSYATTLQFYSATIEYTTTGP